MGDGIRNGHHWNITTTDFSDYIDSSLTTDLGGLHGLLELKFYNSQIDFVELNLRDKEYSTTTDYADYIDLYFDNGLRRIKWISRIEIL